MKRTKITALVLAACAGLIISLASFDKTEDKLLTFRLTIAETEQILGALQEQPYKQSSPLINKLVSQAQQQLADSTKKK